MNDTTSEARSYTDTAYDSSRPRQLPPMSASVEDSPRRRLLVRGRGKQCGEYLAVSNADAYIPQLKALTETQVHRMEREDSGEGICETWQSLKNMAVVVDQITFVLGFWLCTAGIGGFVLALWLWGFTLETLYGLTISVFNPLALYILGKVALKRKWVKNKNNTVLNRCTGKVTFTYNKRRRSIPFDEFAPYLSVITNPTGSSDYLLRLVHRYSARSVVQPNSYNTPWEAEVGWEMLQQFMDIARPLPDVPGWELTRRYDPTSIEYDKEHNRPPDYWRDSDREQMRKWVAASRKAAEAFPWGSTREQALAAGWKPSGVGEGDWLDIHKQNARVAGSAG